MINGSWTTNFLAVQAKPSMTADIIEGLLTTIHDITTTQKVMRNCNVTAVRPRAFFLCLLGLPRASRSSMVTQWYGFPRA